MRVYVISQCDGSWAVNLVYPTVETIATNVEESAAVMLAHEAAVRQIPSTVVEVDNSGLSRVVEELLTGV